MSQQNVAAIRALYEAFNRGDFETMKKGFNPDFERFEPENSLYAEGNPYRGFEGSRNGVYSPRMRDFENWRTELEDLHDAGDFIITTGRYKARCKATGKDLSTQFCHILHLDGSGRIDRLQGYTDTLKEAEVAGRVQRLEHMRMEQPVM
jgi:ketosteroid isomerase-like protein